MGYSECQLLVYSLDFTAVIWNMIRMCVYLVFYDTPNAVYSYISFSICNQIPTELNILIP